MSTFETLAKGKLLSKQTVRLRGGQTIETDIHEWEIDTIGFMGHIFHDGQWIAVKAVFVENEAMNRLDAQLGKGVTTHGHTTSPRLVVLRPRINGYPFCYLRFSRNQGWEW